MSKIALTMVLTILLATVMVPREVGSTYIPIDPYILSPKEVITYYSDIYGADEKLLLAMADCESNFNPSAIGDGGRAKSIFQYHRGTFDRYAKLFGQQLDYHSYHDQAKLTAWLSVSNPKALNEWTSYRAIQNGGVYKFYSKLLQRHFVVYCHL